ncbi:MAG: FtsX-like permease family protein [Bryobacteraceae bacterium]
MTGKLVLENLKHKPMRSLLSILLIGVPVTLILCLVGLSHGFLEDSQRRTRGIGADVIVRPPGSTLLTLSGGISDKIVDWLGQQPHVKMAVGAVNQPVQGITLGATGIDLKQFDRMSGGFTYLHGGPFQGPDDVIIDQFYADQQRARVGDRITILNTPWRVCGIIEGGKLAHIVFPLGVLQEKTSHIGQVSQIYLKLDDPANTAAVVQSLKEKLPDYPVYSMAEFTSLYNVNNIPALREFIIVIMAIGVIIGFAVVCLSMYMAVLQRTREIGILKSLGASQVFILRIILTEAVILGIGGTVLGIVMSFGACWLIRTLEPASIPMVIVPVWWAIAGAVTLIGAAFGALYPGLSAARHDTIEALAYE